MAGEGGSERSLGIAVAAAILLPGLLLVLPGGPVPDGAARGALFALLAVVAASALPPAPPRAAVLGLLLALATGWGFWLAPAHARLAGGRGLTFLLLALWLPLAANHHRAPETARRALGALGAAGVATALWVLLDRATGRPPVGPVGRTGVAGPLLAALLPCLAALDEAVLAGRRLALRALPWILTGAGLVATTSRTSWVAAGVGLLLLGGARATTQRAARRTLALGTGILALAALLAFLSVTDRLPGGSWIGRSDTVAVRVGLWRASERLVREHPLAGHGQGSFPAAILRTRDLAEARISGGRRPLEAHSDLAHHAVEGGLPAASAYLLLVGAALLYAWRRARRTEGLVRAVLASCTGGLAALAVAGFAENPLLEPPTAVLFALLAGTVAGVGTPRGRGHGTAAWGLRVATTLGGLLLAFVLGREAWTQFQVARNRWSLPPSEVAALLAGPENPAALATLRDAAPGVTAGDALGTYRLGTRLARAGWYAGARGAFGDTLRADPGASEALLDTAETWRLEGNRAAAQEALEEARRRDPTRFDVPMREGHLLLGPEPPPSRRAPPADPVAVLRLYNEAAALDPNRWEVPVAYARVHRRRGELVAAGAALRRAKELRERVDPTLPDELVLESFRLAEAEGAPSEATTAILALALRVSPRTLAAEITAEALACLEAMQAGIEAPEPDPKAVAADFEAATRRWTALVASRRADPADLTRRAQAAVEAGQDRAALSIYLALLADPTRIASSELLSQARAVAARVDRPLGERLAIRLRSRLGDEALARGEFPAAERQYRIALSNDMGFVEAHLGLARALLRQGHVEAAQQALARGVEADEAVATAARQDTELAGLLR